MSNQFMCPNGHIFGISDVQADGFEPIECSQCEFAGDVYQGELLRRGL